jgi:hypothetical protein
LAADEIMVFYASGGMVQTLCCSCLFAFLLLERNPLSWSAEERETQPQHLSQRAGILPSGSVC